MAKTREVLLMTAETVINEDKVAQLNLRFTAMVHLSHTKTIVKETWTLRDVTMHEFQQLIRYGESKKGLNCRLSNGCAVGNYKLDGKPFMVISQSIHFDL